MARDDYDGGDKHPNAMYRLAEKRLGHFIGDLAVKADEHGDETWCADFENDVFMMHRYCWCERKACPWCNGRHDEHRGYDGDDLSKRAPNFHYKPLDYRVWWYKTNGRQMRESRPLTAAEFEEMKRRCFESLTPCP